MIRRLSFIIRCDEITIDDHTVKYLNDAHVRLLGKKGTHSAGYYIRNYKDMINKLIRVYNKSTPKHKIISVPDDKYVPTKERKKSMGERDDDDMSLSSPTGGGGGGGGRASGGNSGVVEVSGSGGGGDGKRSGGAAGGGDGSIMEELKKNVIRALDGSMMSGDSGGIAKMEELRKNLILAMDIRIAAEKRRLDETSAEVPRSKRTRRGPKI